MNTREKEYNRYLRKLAENLDISDTMRDKAIESYAAVGRWLGDCADDSSVKIAPQGSFYLGTVVKPVSDKDEYDIDLVCLLKDKHGASEYEIKNLVGDRLKEHGTYAKMLDSEEGKRCWTLNYDEFHMDILPSAPKDSVYLEPYLTALRLTKLLQVSISRSTVILINIMIGSKSGCKFSYLKSKRNLPPKIRLRYQKFRYIK